MPASASGVRFSARDTRCFHPRPPVLARRIGSARTELRGPDRKKGGPLQQNAHVLAWLRGKEPKRLGFDFHVNGSVPINLPLWTGLVEERKKDSRVARRDRRSRSPSWNRSRSRWRIFALPTKWPKWNRSGSFGPGLSVWLTEDKSGFRSRCIRNAIARCRSPILFLILPLCRL